MSGQTSGRVRVGIVGANSTRGWASMSHLPALAALPDVELVAVATTQAASAQACADTFGVPNAFTNAQDLANHPDVDLVAVTVKAPDHAAVIRAALAAGKHVLCEWPLGVDLDEAVELASEANAAGVVHAIGLQGVHSPGARFVHDFIAEGNIGRVVSLSLVTSSGFGGSQIPEARAWTADARAGVSLLSITGGHSLATLATTVGPLRDIAALTATMTTEATVAETGVPLTVDTPDQIGLVGSLANGAIVSVMLHGNTPPAAGGFTLRITGTEATLLVTQVAVGGSIHHDDWAITLVRADNSVEALPVPASYTTIPAGVPAGAPANVAAVYLEVAAAIREGRPAIPSFDAAVEYHRILSAIDASVTTGRRQTL